LEQVVLTLTGPSTVWYGVGFGASEMKGAAWSVIVDGLGQVTERHLGDHTAGTILAPSVNVTAMRVTGTLRTVVLTRGLRGTFNFDENSAEIPLITAVGTGRNFAYHKDKTATSLALVPAAGPSVGGACVCPEQPAPFGHGKGSFVYTPVAGDQGERGQATSLRFNNICAPQPRGDLLVQKNPTCDVRTYTGGQIACHHMFSLLDADQPIPWPDKPLTYTLKFRFWYQDYDPARHTTVRYSHLGKGTDWSIGAGPMAPGYGAEYDVPKCSEGMPGCTFEDGTWVHTITGNFVVNGGGKPVVAHLHCHAPTCLSMAVYNNLTGRLICEEKAMFGQDTKGDKFGEPGFIVMPPCVWGSAEDGLEPPPDLTGVPLHVVKRANATHAHHGEMAHGEIYYVDQPPTAMS